MGYNLAKYKFQPGDRVSIPDSHGGVMRHFRDGVLIAEWDASKGRTGTIVDVWKSGTGNSTPWIVVAPDPEYGFGEWEFPVDKITRAE